MGDWPLRPLSAVATVFDGPHATPTKTESGPWYLSISSLQNGRFDLAASAHLADEDLPRWTKRVAPQPGDTLFSYETRIGQAAHWNLEAPAALGRRMGLLRPKREVVDARFLTYAYLGPQFQEVVRSKTVHGATVERLLIADMPSWPIVVPDMNEQRRIAAVLGALDDLIEAERHLATAAAALVATVFDRRFGNRPLELEVSALGSVIDCLHSKKPEVVAGGRTLMQLNNIRDDGLVDRGPSYGISDTDYANWSRKLETRPWDVVVTNVGRIGAVARIPEGYEVAIGRNMTAIRLDAPDACGAFLIASLLSAAVRGEIDARTDSGTVMNALNVRSIPLLRLQRSTGPEREAFQRDASPLLRQADASLAAVLDLTRTRDELLPLLMSGKVRVSKDLAVA